MTTRAIQSLEHPALDPGLRTYFRLAEVEDAAFICSLRGDDRLNRHLNTSPVDVEAQRQWLDRYKARERAGEEFYFVIMHEGRERGVVRMYDFRDVRGRSSFCWGSWIIPPPKVPGLATFSALLIYELGFDALGFRGCHFDVRRENRGVIAFHQRAGAQAYGETDQDILFEFLPEHHRQFRALSKRQMSEHRVAWPATADAAAT